MAFFESELIVNGSLFSAIRHPYSALRPGVLVRQPCAGLYLQKTFAYSHEDKLCDSIGVVACGVAVLLPGARLYQLRLSAREFAEG